VSGDRHRVGDTRGMARDSAVRKQRPGKFMHDRPTNTARAFASAARMPSAREIRISAHASDSRCIVAPRRVTGATTAGGR
jgi:hypothetical protein